MARHRGGALLITLHALCKVVCQQTAMQSPESRIQTGPCRMRTTNGSETALLSTAINNSSKRDEGSSESFLEHKERATCKNDCGKQRPYRW